MKINVDVYCFKKRFLLTTFVGGLITLFLLVTYTDKLSSLNIFDDDDNDTVDIDNDTVDIDAILYLNNNADNVDSFDNIYSLLRPRVKAMALGWGLKVRQPNQV